MKNETHQHPALDADDYSYDATAGDERQWSAEEVAKLRQRNAKAQRKPVAEADGRPVSAGVAQRKHLGLRRGHSAQAEAD